MRLMGAGLLEAAGLLAGLMAAGRLRERAAERAELCRMLALLRFELARFRTPLPGLFAHLGEETRGRAGALCRQVAAGLAGPERRELAALWAQAIEGLEPAERKALAPLGPVLGRYGAEEQLLAVDGCLAAMERARDEAAAALRERGRMTVGLAAAGAALAAVLLL